MNGSRWGEVPEYARRPLEESKAHDAAQESREAARWALDDAVHGRAPKRARRAPRRHTFAFLAVLRRTVRRFI